MPACPVPRRFLIGIALLIAIPDLLLIPQLLLAARLVGQRVTEWHVESLVSELVRPVFSVSLAFAVTRGRWLLMAAIYLALRIITPIVLAMRSSHAVSWAYTPILLHVLAFVGVVYAMCLRRYSRTA